MKWIQSMRDLGLNDDEIVAIRQVDSITTKGKTAEQLREDIRRLNS